MDKGWIWGSYGVGYELENGVRYRVGGGVWGGVNTLKTNWGRV